MQELKQILISRIRDIKELEEPSDVRNDAQNVLKTKRQIILKQKNGESYRIRRQNILLANLSGIKLSEDKHLNQVYACLKNIAESYDATINYQKDEKKEDTVINKVYLFLSTFFMRHGFQQKIIPLQVIFKKNIFFISLELLFAWFSEWSKKKYFEVIQKIVRGYECNLQGSHSLRYLRENLASCQKINTMDQEKKEISYSVRRQKSITENNQNKELTHRSKRFCIGNRQILHRYLQQQLINYYQFVDLEELDHKYLKNLEKKSKRKGDLTSDQNLQKAISAIIDTTKNKQVQLSIQEYQNNHSSFRKRRMVEIKEKKAKKKEQQIINPQKNDSDRASISLPKISKNNISEDKLKASNRYLENRNREISSRSQNLNILPKQQKKQKLSRSQIAEQITQRLYASSNKTQKLIMKLPQISAPKQIFQSKIIKFPTQMNEEARKKIQQLQKTDQPVFFSHRKPSKNTMLNKYLINRNKQYSLAEQIYSKGRQKVQRNKKPTLEINQSVNKSSIDSICTNKKDEIQEESYHIVKIHKKQIKMSIRNLQKNKQIHPKQDLYSLRVKTKALLKNLNKIQKY